MLGGILDVVLRGGEHVDLQEPIHQGTELLEHPGLVFQAVAVRDDHDPGRLAQAAVHILTIHILLEELERGWIGVQHLADKQHALHVRVVVRIRQTRVAVHLQGAGGHVRHAGLDVHRRHRRAVEVPQLEVRDALLHLVDEGFNGEGLANAGASEKQEIRLGSVGTDDGTRGIFYAHCHFSFLLICCHGGQVCIGRRGR